MVFYDLNLYNVSLKVLILFNTLVRDTNVEYMMDYFFVSLFIFCVSSYSFVSMSFGVSNFNNTVSILHSISFRGTKDFPSSGDGYSWGSEVEGNVIGRVRGEITMLSKCSIGRSDCLVFLLYCVGPK